MRPRPVSVGDWVTWGDGLISFRVVRIDPDGTGVYVDATHTPEPTKNFVSWNGNRTKPLRFAGGDPIDVPASVRFRDS